MGNVKSAMAPVWSSANSDFVRGKLEKARAIAGYASHLMDNLYRSTPSSNIIASPLVLSVALEMLSEGINPWDSHHRNLLRSMLNTPANSLEGVWELLLSDYSGTSTTRVREVITSDSATSIRAEKTVETVSAITPTIVMWVDKADEKISEQFQVNAAKKYLADIHEVSFADPDKLVSIINERFFTTSPIEVADIPESTGPSAMVITGMSFTGFWDSDLLAFTDSAAQGFTPLNMNQRETTCKWIKTESPASLPYRETSDMQIVHMPYLIRGSDAKPLDIHFVLILPKAAGPAAMRKVSAALTADPSVLDSGKSVSLTLTMPTFKFTEHKVDIMKTMKTYNVLQEAEETALNGILTSGKHLKEIRLLHVVSFAFSELGSSEMLGVEPKKTKTKTKPTTDPVQITANRTFLFLIYDAKNKLILLSGMVNSV